jgi:hypothetical protein
MCVLLRDHTEYKPPSISGRLVLKYDIITMVYTMVIVAAVITSPFIKSAGNISVSIHIFDKISSVDKSWKPDSVKSTRRFTDFSLYDFNITQVHCSRPNLNQKWRWQAVKIKHNEDQISDRKKGWHLYQGWEIDAKFVKLIDRDGKEIRPTHLEHKN